jgi:hypothetical protein
MSLDSTANLLFSIGANTDDAEANIKRFRALLSKDLTGIGTEFTERAKEILGSITTVQGAAVAAGAVIGTALVGVAALANDAANKYAEYVSEVARGTRATGLSMEAMSALHEAAEETRTSYDTLVRGLSFFARTTDEATHNQAKYNDTFGRLGITQEQVKAGNKELWPLLQQVADAFAQLDSKQSRTVMSTGMFRDRTGELGPLLAQGSAGLEKFAEKVREMGLELHNQDKLNVAIYKASLKEMQELHEALEVKVGRTMLPIKTKWEEAKVAVVETVREVGIFGAVVETLMSPQRFGERVATAMKRIDAEIHKTAESLGKLGDTPLAPPKVEVAKEAWSGLSDVLAKVRERTEDVTSVDARAAKELAELQREIDKTVRKYEELHKAGKLKPEDEKTEAAAMAQRYGALSELMTHYIAEINRKNEEAGEDLKRRINAQQEQTLEIRLEGWADQYAALARQLAKEGALIEANRALLHQYWTLGEEKIRREQEEKEQEVGAEMAAMLVEQGEKTYAQKNSEWDRLIEVQSQKWSKIVQIDEAFTNRVYEIWLAGQARIDREAKAAYDAEMGRLSTHLESILARNTTHEQQLAAQYAKDAQAYSQAEEAKAKATATTEPQRLAIERAFGQMRTQITQKYAQDLQALRNSQGWQGVFGNEFAKTIRGNEALTREWATSTHQSAMMVRVTLEALKETAQDTFGSFAQGMGSSIADAIVYKKSIGEAMQAAAASTLESLAAEALVYSIYSFGLGWLRLAQYDYTGATQAFTAAAIWGGVGGATALAGRAIAPASASAQTGSTSGTSSGSGTSSAASAGSSGSGSGQTVPTIQINVMGHLYGNADAVIDAINDAVLTRDKTLTATNTTTGQVVRR